MNRSVTVKVLAGTTMRVNLNIPWQITCTHFTFCFNIQKKRGKPRKRKTLRKSLRQPWLHYHLHFINKQQITSRLLFLLPQLQQQNHHHHYLLHYFYLHSFFYYHSYPVEKKCCSKDDEDGATKHPLMKKISPPVEVDVRGAQSFLCYFIKERFF